MALQLFVNTQASTLANALVRSATDTTPIPLPELVLGDQRPCELYFVDPTTGTFEPWSGSASYSPYLALGTCGNPTGGTFTLTFGANTTAALAYNITPAALQTALQGLASIGANNCTVTGVAGIWYQVTFIGSKGDAAQSLIVGDGALLSPESGVNSSTLTAGDSTHNAVQLITLTLNPISFASGWTPITNGWSGNLSMLTVETVAALAGLTTLSTGFQISVLDPSSVRRTYVKTTATVNCSIIQPNAFAGPNILTYATTAQLAAATLASGLFTQEALSSSAAGNTNITRPSGSHYHTGYVTVTGAAGTRTISVLTTNTPAAGDTIRVYLSCPATSGIILQVYNASTGGTLLKTFTTDGSGLAYTVELEYSGSAWQIVGGSNGSGMQTTQNLAGLANIITARQNIGALFAKVSAKSANFTVATTEDGTFYPVTTSTSSLVATLPSAATAGSGFSICISKSDIASGSIATSPSTLVLLSQYESIILVSDGANWNIAAHSGQQVNVNSPINMSQLTGLAGGGATNLDGLTTADGRYPTGTIVVLSYNTAIQHWKLYASTAASDPTNGVVRPTDYNGTTNQLVWKLIG